MKQQSIGFAILWCALQLASEGSEAFAPSLEASSARRASSLNLVPEQGNQLVAAYNAICVEQQKQKAAKVPIQVEKHNTGAIAECKAFLTRVFHMPSIKHPGASQSNTNNKKIDDVVYYPMVGFRFFADIDTVFPTTSHVSCVIPTKSQKEEEVYGWFSSSCELDFFSEEYCQNPIHADDEECRLQ